MPSVSLEVALCTPEDVTVRTAAGTRMTYVRTITNAGSCLTQNHYITLTCANKRRRVKSLKHATYFGA